MGRILIAWELGGGLGHLAVLRPVAESLARRGHRILLAARNLDTARRVFRDAQVQLTQAPYKSTPVTNPFRPQRSFAHLLHHAGFDDEEELSTMCRAWLRLIDSFRPDVGMFDHSPTALLASRGRQMRRVLIGTGFCAPPADEFLPDMRPWLPKDSARLERDELLTLRVANRASSRISKNTLDRLSGIYSQVDQNYLTTFPELDHFGARSNAGYWGTFQECPGVSPVWPKGSACRVFAYLKPCRGLSETIKVLGASDHSVVMFAPWANARIRSQFNFANILFSAQPLDMAAVANECDFAILNGTHGATAELLLAGKPVLQLPIYLEQRLVARRTIELGAGLKANCTSTLDFSKKLDAVAHNSEYTSNAKKFAAKYAQHNGFTRFEEMSESISDLAL